MPITKKLISKVSKLIPRLTIHSTSKKIAMNKAIVLEPPKGICKEYEESPKEVIVLDPHEEALGHLEFLPVMRVLSYQEAHNH